MTVPVGCANGWAAVPIGASNLQRTVQVGTWLACLVPLAWWAWQLRGRRLRADAAGGAPPDLLARLGEAAAWSGFAATLVSLAPVGATSVCV